MDQQTLFHESLADALLDTINQLGGPKRVGLALWPSKSMQQAQTNLLNCLNDDRPEKFGLEEIDHILRLAREQGVLTPFKYLADQFDLELRVIDPEDKRAALQREFVQRMDDLSQLAKRFERLTK